MNGSIICGVDDSTSAHRAVRVARRLSSTLGLRLVLARIVESSSPAERISALAARLGSLAEEAAGDDAGVRWVLDVGHPADRLVELAEEEQAAFVVVGSTGPRSSLLGSISADVSRRAPCPVVIVPPGGDLALDGGEGSEDAELAAVGTAGRTLPGGEIRVAGHPRREDDFAGGIFRFNLGRGA